MNDNNFFSLDRLVEFGLSVNIATQMIKVMNESMSQMYVPGADNSFRQPASLLYAIVDGNRIGPMSEGEFMQLISQNKVDSTTYVWKPGMPAWKQASEVPEVLRLVALTPPEFNG